MTSNAAARLLETDTIDWTAEKLSRRIGETRELLKRIDGQQVEDEDLIWIHQQLAEDLKRKEAMLKDLGGS
jgi:hypothetical protein